MTRKYPNRNVRSRGCRRSACRASARRAPARGVTRRQVLMGAGAVALGAAGMSVAKGHAAHGRGEEWRAGPTVKAIRNRGNLRGCIPSYDIPPFTGPSLEGIDIDYYGALGAAIFDTPDPDGDGVIDYVELPYYEQLDDHDWNDRFNLLQGNVAGIGKIDVASMIITPTFSRDTFRPTYWKDHVQFSPSIIHDAVRIAYRTGYYEIDDYSQLDGAVIGCIVGTTTEGALDKLIAEGYTITKVTYTNSDDGYDALRAGDTDGMIDDYSAMIAELGADLVAGLTVAPNPLGLAIAEGDSKFHDILNWTVWATFAATAYGITQANVGSYISSGGEGLVTEGRQLLGIDPLNVSVSPLTPDETVTKYMPEYLGLAPSAFANIIRAVGNWGEIWDRHLTPVGFPRGGINSVEGRMFFPVIG